MWEFHTIHHSQRELNLFSDLRVHAVDALVAAVIKFIPLGVLAIESPDIVAWIVFHTW
jgi:sterol desaturase/sphingolipid hydroxylase (fatty acid hydroxylase superfamily)